MNMLRSLIVAALLALGLATPAYSQSCSGQFPNNTFCGYTGGAAKGLPVPTTVPTGSLTPIAGGTVLGNPTAATAVPQATSAPVLGIPGSVLGQIGVAGSTSGTITIQPQGAAGTYNFNLPTSSGTNGQPLLSGGGGASPMTFGTLQVPAGGTGLTSGTSGGIPYFSSATTMASSAILAANQIVLGGGAGNSPATLGTLGTTTTVLHGNASGAPTFGPVSLTADVSGILPLANGGTNAALTASNGGIVYSGSSALAVLAGTATARQMLQSGSSGAPAWSTATWPDATTQNQILYSSAANIVSGLASTGGGILNTNSSGVPSVTATPSLGIAGSVAGTLTFNGVTSGGVTVQPQSAAGTVTLTLPNTSGTVAAGASSPLVLSATTGILTCPTCVTSSGGGSVTGVAPIAVSGAGAVSITGAAGTVLAGSAPSFTATPTLGVAGSTLGTLAFANLTSGSITLQPVSGALGSAVLTLPAATDTVAVLAASQALTNKTYNGLTVTASTGTLTIANSKTLTTSNTLTFTGTDGSSVAFGTGGTVTYTIATGTAALGTSAISAGTCATVVTVSATGTATTDVVDASFNGDPTAVTGYTPGAMLSIVAYPTANNANFKVCNNTSGSITPGAITLNWKVRR